MYMEEQGVDCMWLWGIHTLGQSPVERHLKDLRNEMKCFTGINLQAKWTSYYKPQVTCRDLCATEMYHFLIYYSFNNLPEILIQAHQKLK